MFRILLLTFAFVKSTEQSFWEKVMADNKVFYHMQHIIQFQSRCMSDPPLSDNDLKKKMAWVWTTLNSEYLLWFGIKFSRMFVASHGHVMLDSNLIILFQCLEAKWFLSNWDNDMRDALTEFKNRDAVLSYCESNCGATKCDELKSEDFVSADTCLRNGFLDSYYWIFKSIFKGTGSIFFIFRFEIYWIVIVCDWTQYP